MHRLEQRYRGERAAVVLGGASLVEQRCDLSQLRKKGFIVFLESKALTPYFLQFGMEPDYYLMLFPEKCVCNALQNFVFRSFLAQVDIAPFLKPAYRPVADHMRTHFESYFEPWRLHRGPHKRYRWRPGVFLAESPVELLSRIPRAHIIANRSLLAAYFRSRPFENPVREFESVGLSAPFNPQTYYAPVVDADGLKVREFGFFNSAAIALYPLLEFMGFETAYFLGMDMTMLGSLEYAAPYTFQSLAQFQRFFKRTQQVFNPAYRPNQPFYFRPKSEFEDAQRTLAHGRTRWVRVYDPGPYAAPLDGVRTISTSQFQQG